MFSINIQEKGGESRRMAFNKAEVTIGRVQGNDIVLPKGNVSKRHARIVLKDGKFIIVDLKSTNGTYVNGRKITSPLVVKDADKIYIGDFIIGVDESSIGVAGDAAAEAPPPVAPPPERLPSRPTADQEPPRPPPRPTRDQPAALAPREPAPLPPREPMAVPPSIAPIAAPPRPQAQPRPAGGTLPPPQPQPPAYVPPPVAAPPPVAPMPAPIAPAPPMAAPQAPVAAPTVAAAAEPSRPRLVGAGAAVAPAPRAVVVRSVGVARAAKIEPLAPQVVKLLEIQSGLLERLRVRLDLDKVPVERLGDEELWQKAERTIIDLVEATSDLPKGLDSDTLIKETLNEALGLGPLEDLLADPKLDEIVVDRRDRVLVGTGGVLRGSGRAFSSEDALLRVLERLVAPLGRVIDELEPMVDVRLPDGSRLTALVPPLATQGACLTLRKARAAMPSLPDLVGAGAMSPAMADHVAKALVARRNLLVCGAPGSGRTQVISALAGAMPAGERVITIEEVAELAPGRAEWVGLEARPGDAKSAAIDQGQLLRVALRLGADRLVVGEVTGREALAVASTLATSSDGGVVGVAGDGCAAGLARLVTLARLADVGEGAARELVATAIDEVLHVVRFADGMIRVHAIERVTGVGDGGVTTQPLFAFQAGAYVDLGGR